MYIGGRSAGEGIAMPGDYREVGFKDTCEKYKVEHLVMVTDKEQFDTLEYYSFVRNRLEKNRDVDGVFASSDIIGAYVLQACRDLSISVPKNMKIVGFDDCLLYTSPSPRDQRGSRMPSSA